MTMLIVLLNISFSATYKFSADAGKTNFLVIGKPSFVKVLGEGIGAKGDLIEEKGIISGELTLDLSSLTTKNELRDDHMKNTYLEVSKFKEAKVKIKDFKNPEKTDVETPFEGTLTLRNIEKPIKGKVTLQKIDGKESIQAKFDVNLYDHEIRPKFLGITVTEKAEINIQATPQKVE